MADFDSPEMVQAIDELEKRNYSAALTLLMPLAEAGNPRAQCNLALLYQTGLGVEPNGEKAVELYQRVAEQNIHESCLSGVAYNNLATIYITGAPGIEPDHGKAGEFKERARALGFEM